MSNQDKVFVRIPYEDREKFCRKLGIQRISLRSIKKKYPHATAVKRIKRVRNSPYIIVIQKYLKVTNMKVFTNAINPKDKDKLIVVSAKTKKKAYELVNSVFKMSSYKFNKYWKRTRQVVVLKIAVQEGVWVYDKRLNVHIQAV